MTKVCPVTEAMVEAGVLALYEFDLETQPYAEAVRAVYTAMEAARIPDPEAAKLREALVLARTIVASDAAACAAFSAPDETSHPQCVLDVIDEALNPSPALVGDEDAAR